MPEINVLAVVLIAVASMVIGFVWYSPMLFANAWMKEIGLKMEDLKGGSGVGYLMTTIGSVIMAIVMGILVSYLNITRVIDGVFLGVLIWVGFVATSFMANYIFSHKSLRLFLIDCGYFFVSLATAGAIYGLLR
jgi:hypothetical protein